MKQQYHTRSKGLPQRTKARHLTKMNFKNVKKIGLNMFLYTLDHINPKTRVKNLK